MTLNADVVNQMIGYAYDPIQFSYTERDTALYALAVGAPAHWLDPDELAFVYELSAQGFKALPTFPVLYPGKMIDVLVSGRIGSIEFNPMMLVHGEQYLEIKKSIPTCGQITCRPRISAIYDKGSGILIVTDTPCYDAQGEEVAFNQAAMFIRGLGGFGGERGPSAAADAPPDRPPDAVQEEQTQTRQALLYRLCGDINPLHADPMMAALGGFDRPILHGLCTFGYAGRAVLKHFCANDPARFKSIKVRFSRHVFPGETLRTEMWQISETRVVFQTRVVERCETALSNAVVELRL